MYNTSDGLTIEALVPALRQFHILHIYITQMYAFLWTGTVYDNNMFYILPTSVNIYIIITINVWSVSECMVLTLYFVCGVCIALWLNIPTRPQRRRILTWMSWVLLKLHNIILSNGSFNWKLDWVKEIVLLRLYRSTEVVCICIVCFRA